MSVPSRRAGEGRVASRIDARLLAEVVYADRFDWARLGGADPDAVCAAADTHGVLPLVAERLAAASLCPAPIVEALGARAAGMVAADLAREQELRRVLAGLRGSGLDALLMKGAALAYTHYPRPDLRPRLDTDLIVPAHVRPRAHAVLVALGYEPEPQLSGDLVMYQAAYTRRAPGGLPHVVDLHWRAANPQQFGHLFDYDELLADAVPIPALAPEARGLGPVHALLLACVHRVAHHADADVLIWVYDVHLLAGSLSPTEWARFTTLADARHVASVCRRSLELAISHFHTQVPSGALESLRAGSGTAAEALTSAYLARPRRLQQMVWDLRAFSTWADRWRLVRQHLFPSAWYMRHVYAPASRAPLGALYAWRMVRGARKWLVRPQLPR